MFFLLQEEIDDFTTFENWFTNEAIPQIEAVGGKCLVMGVDTENENMLHLVMETMNNQREYHQAHLQLK